MAANSKLRNLMEGIRGIPELMLGLLQDFLEMNTNRRFSVSACQRQSAVSQKFPYSVPVVPLWLGLAFLAATSFAQDAVRRYDLAGGEATDALRAFARASGLQLLFPERAIRGTELPPLHGEFAADEALKRLLAESGLEAVSDPTTGAYAVRRRVAVPS